MLPLLLAAAAPAIGAGIASLFSKKPKTEVVKPYAIGKTQDEWGMNKFGHSGDEANVSGWRGDAYENQPRQGAPDQGMLGYGQMNAGNGFWNEAGARQAQSNALGLMGQAAVGATPSLAQMQLQQGMGQAMGQNRLLASQVGGGGGNALAAQHMAMQQNGAMNSQLGQQMAMLRAKEMEDARQQYFSGASGMRAGDMGQQQLGQQQLGQFSQLGLQGQGQLDAMTQFYRSLQANQQQTQRDNEQRTAQFQTALSTGNAAFAQQQQDRADKMVGAGISTGASMAPLIYQATKGDSGDQDPKGKGGIA